MRPIKNILFTFLIGFIAGVSPFIFMQLLPELLSQSHQPREPPYVAIILTGILVGAITSIIFAKTFDQRDPQEVFFYALGIPAILIATVSNISTKYEARQTVADTKAEASSIILSPPPPEPTPVQLEIAPPPKPAHQSLLWRKHVWAEEREGGNVTRLAETGGYLVVIGTYTSADEAWKTLYKLSNTKLKTELYIPKNLRVLQGGAGSYYVSYSAPLSRDEAIKLYNLIRINDPYLAPQILKQE